MNATDNRGTTNGTTNSMAKSEFIGYMKRAIEDIGRINTSLEKRVERLENKINNIEIKIATIAGGLIVVWYLARELITKRLKI